MKTQKTQKTQNRIQKFFATVAFVLIGLVVITATSKAQTVPESRAESRAYALEQVAGSHLTVFGEAMIWNANSITEVDFHPVDGTTVEAAVAAINANSFKFKVSNKSKPLYAWAELHNASGTALFHGYVELSIGPKGEIVYNTVNLKTNLSYTGPRASLVKTVNRGKTSLFNITGSVGVRLDDFQAFNDTGMAANTTMYVGAVGYVGNGHEAPVVSFKLSSPRPVCFSSGIYSTVDYSLIESPITGSFFLKGYAKESVNLIPGQWSTPVILPAGEYFFFPNTSIYE